MRIGLEVHVQLAVREKLFSGALANGSCGLFDWACPGVLPVLNRQAVEQAVRSALVLGCTRLSKRLCFDRKHYRYHDLPLGYQITQHRHPLAEHGAGPAAIRRIQLEQDTGRTLGTTSVDLRRAGNALIEIVTDPVFDSIGQAREFARRTVRTLVDAGTTEGRLEDGHVRFDVNVSGSGCGRAEIKNLNSYHFIQLAVEQLPQHLALGSAIKTFGFDQKTLRLHEMRTKETYFYLPDPDIPPMVLSDQYISVLRRDVRPSRFALLDQVGLPGHVAERLRDVPYSRFSSWNELYSMSRDPMFAYKWMILEAEKYPGASSSDARMIAMAVFDGKISRRQAQALFRHAAEGRGTPSIPEPRPVADVVGECLERGIRDPHRIINQVLTYCPVDPSEARRYIEQAVLTANHNDIPGNNSNNGSSDDN